MPSARRRLPSSVQMSVSRFAFLSTGSSASSTSCRSARRAEARRGFSSTTVRCSPASCCGSPRSSSSSTSRSDMPDFNVRSDSVNVEQIMEQIRARIREKRGVDYTEQQIREMAAVKLEKFLDPRGVRSDLLNEFRRVDPDPNYAFEDDTLFRSTRGLVEGIRRLLRPILKLFFNPNPLIHVLHMQSQINNLNANRHQLYYELIHNLVVETT